MNVVPKQIVLAYSGGLDTSVIMRWLIETYRCPVVAFVANVGQQEDLEAIAHKAQQTGASQVCVEDVREIRSHPVALDQCRGLLASMPWATALVWSVRPLRTRCCRAP